MKTLYTSVLLMILASIMQAQVISIPIKVSNNKGNADTLILGLDESATDGIDTKLGEAELPPLPPKEAFDVRLKMPDPRMEYSLKDFRYGKKAPYSTITKHQLEYQFGLGTSVTIEWNLPSDVKGTIKDLFGGVILNKEMLGSDSVNITNMAMNKLEIVVSYNLKTDIKNNELPLGFELMQNYPNPFNPATVISYQIAVANHVTLKVYDAMGREVATLVDEVQQSGFYNSQFKIQNYQLSSSVYFYELRAGNFRDVKKLILMK